MVDQEIRVLGDENIIANPKNSQKQYPLTFKAVPNVIVYGRKKDNLNFTVPIPEGVNFNFNLDRTSIIFADNFNLEEYSYIMVKNPFEEIQDFFYVSSLEELDPTGKEFNEFNDEVVKWLRRLVNIISNRCMIFETTLFKDLNNFPNIKSGQTFIRTEDGWTGITIRDINSELDVIFNKYVEEVNKKIQEHQVQMNELLEQWKQDIQKYAENVKQYEIVRIVTQSGHGFIFEPVMYSISQRKFVKALFPHGADGIAVRVDDNNFRLVWAGRVEIPAAAKDTQQRDFVLGEYYFLGEGSNGGIQREKPDTYYQHLFQVMYSDELQQNIADILLSVPINQKGKRWDIGEAKTTVNDIEELKMSDFPVDKVVEVLGYYKAGDGADHKRIISSTDDGSGVQLSNGKWANIVHNGEINVSWLGCKKDDESFFVKNSEIVNNQLKNKNTHLFFSKGTWSFNQIKFNSFCSLKGEGKEITFLKQVGEITNVGQSIFKNHSFLQAIEDKNGAFNANAFSVISNMTIKGIKQSNINGIGFSGTENNIENKSEWNDQHTLIENVEVREFYNGIYFGYYYKENRIDKVISRYNSNSGIIYKGTDFFISNTTCHSNDVNGFELIGGESRLEFSKAFYNKKVGLILYGAANVNNFSSQENFETGIKIIGNGQAHNLTNLFIGSNGISGGSPAHIKENSSGIEISANDCKIFLTLNTSDFRGNQDGLGMSYSYNLIKFTGKYNSVVGNINCQFRFKEFFDLNNNFLKVTFNGQDLSKSWTQSEWDYIDGDEMILGYGYIEDVPNERFVGIFGNWELINPFVDQSILKEKNNFKMRIQRYSNKSVQAKISHNDVNERWKNKIKIYKKEVSGGAKILMTYTISASYNTIYFNGSYYDASFYFYPQAYRDKFVNDGSYEDVEIVDSTPSVPVSQLNTSYMATKMQQENVYDDYISYMDEKTAYDKQQRKLEKKRQLAYEEALKKNPELAYEEFMSVQPMTLNFVEEPQPSDALKKFMDKYL